MPLRLIIENSPEGEILAMPTHPTSDFVEAALDIAKHSEVEARHSILAEVCEVLSCRPEDLNFLFTHQAVSNSSHSIVGLEVPDFRMRLSEIYTEAAE